jgi:hypothetical protein
MSDGASIEHNPSEERFPGAHFLDRMVSQREGIANCARCGGDHEALDWFVFSRPVPTRYGMYRAWATCPQTADPILFEIQEVREPGPDTLCSASAPDADARG